MSEASPLDEDRLAVFLSYARGDRARAVELVDALAAHGMEVWWDGLLKGGERFASATETALETADAVVVLWSARSIESHWVRDEATRGRDRGCMVSVSLDGSEPPLGFRQIQYIDFANWQGEADARCLGELVEAIELVSAAPGTGLSFAAGSAAGQKRTGGWSRRSTMLLAGGTIAAVGGGVAAWRSGVLAPSAPHNSIAVMAFENLSPDPEQAYFASGLAEELRTILSLNPQLDVMAQASSNSFAGSAASAQEIARALKVSNILEGSVRRADNRVRIVARLVNGGDGFERWSNGFERDFDDILAVQRELATEVVDALLANMLAETAQTQRIGGTASAEAFDAFLKGSALYDLAKDETTDRAALAQFELAIRIDPQYAAAHAALSRANTVMASFYASGTELDAYYDAAMAHAHTAVELAPDLAEGHSALGFALTNGRLDLAGARDPYMRSFELGFGNATILSRFAIYARNIGEFGDARRALERARRLDPLNASIYRTTALVEYAGRDFDAARSAARTALAHNAEIGTAYRLLGDMDLLEGKAGEAQEYYRKEPSSLSRLRGLAMTEYLLNGPEAGDKALSALIEEYGENSLYQQAQVHAQWGQADRAIDALQRGLEIGDSGLVLANSDPMLDPIRQDRRFRAVLQRLGLV